MQPIVILLIILVYFGVLMLISQVTSRAANNQSFFIGNRQSPWYIVAIGMIGASLSGVTFISVPGWVVTSKFFYLQMVFGYLLGYMVIVFVLLPVYYRMKLTSIYTYLENRFGTYSYKTGAGLFLVSRLIGASFRLFLVANVLQLAVFDHFNFFGIEKIPFVFTVIVTLLLIWVYTFRAGIKTIVWTDTLQTLFMLAAVVLTIVMITKSLGLNFSQTVQTISESNYSKIFDFSGWRSESYFWKHFLSGAFITIVMTGLDQDMMQKNLSCRNLKDAQKNMLTYSIAFVPVNLVFMSLGVLLVIFSQQNGLNIPARTDNLFPDLATGGILPSVVAIFFILGLIAAAYSSADSALTALTTSFLVDIVGIKGKKDNEIRKDRILIHLAMSVIIALIILAFKALNNESVVSALFKAAGYTYGPLLGLYAFGFYTKRLINEKWVPAIAVLAPLIMLVLNKYSEFLFDGYKMGFEVLIYNGFLTFLGLWSVSRRKTQVLA
jgi:SSS family solute:Na+ symporter